METLFLTLRVLVALGAILAVIWFVQRKVTGAGGKSAGGQKSAVAGRFVTSKKSITVLGTHRLGAKASITVVEIDGMKMVLGVTEHGISVLENAPVPQVIAPATTTIAHPEAIDPESDLTQVAASAVDTLATADVREEPEPVDFAAVFREALDEASETPALTTVVEQTSAMRETDHVAPRRRRRRVNIPALAEQLLPHMTRTLAAAIGIRVEPKPDVPIEATPASRRPVPLPQTGATGALAAFLRNAEPTIAEEKALIKKDYSTASPLSAHLPVLQRAS
jgi:flagellar protein FliO/FliZ